MSSEERDVLYKSISQKLTMPFPKGSVENTDTPGRASIPVQAYIQRLEEAAGPYWSWRLSGEPVIYHQDEQILVKGILKILDVEREGVGFSNFKTYQDTGKIQNLKSAILSAESDALRKACDKYMMGWKDLAPYRKWANNPAVGLTVDKGNTAAVVAESSMKCVKCGNLLTLEELKFLEENNIRIKYCRKDIPAQLLKKRGE